MPLDRAWGEVEASWHIIILQSYRVEPLFQGFRPPAVTEGITVPNAAQRRDLVKARAAACLQCQRRICSHHNIQNLFCLQKILRYPESLRRSDLVVRIQRRRMASRATLLLEYPLPPAGQIIEGMGV